MRSKGSWPQTATNECRFSAEQRPANCGNRPGRKWDHVDPFFPHESYGGRTQRKHALLRFCMNDGSSQGRLKPTKTKMALFNAYSRPQKSMLLVSTLSLRNLAFLVVSVISNLISSGGDVFEGNLGKPLAKARAPRPTPPLGQLRRLCRCRLWRARRWPLLKGGRRCGWSTAGPGARGASGATQGLDGPEGGSTVAPCCPLFVWLRG